MKIGIYALCKNEEMNIQDWFESCVEADVIAVTDTGSTDNSLHVLKHIQGRVQGGHLQMHSLRVLPWRFDDAFNAAMNHLDADVDVCIRLDFDERLQPGWRYALEQAWTAETTMLRYPYVWNWNDDGSPGFQFYADRIHSRANYRWTGATHEGLSCRGTAVETFTENLRIHQYPDRTKERPNDLPLLEEAVRDTPHDKRLWSYLGREYWWRGDRDNAIKTLKHFLTIGTDLGQRMQAYTILANCEPTNALHWLKKAIGEAPGFREPWVDMMSIRYHQERWSDCLHAATKALEIQKHPMHYVCQPKAWSEYPHDICSMAAYKLGMKELAVEQVKLAIAKNPQDARLHKNLEWFRAA